MNSPNGSQLFIPTKILKLLWVVDYKYAKLWVATRNMFGDTAIQTFWFIWCFARVTKTLV